MIQTPLLLARFCMDRLPPSGQDWLDHALAKDFDRDGLLLDVGAAPRKLGKAPFEPKAAEMAAAGAADIAWLLGGSTVVEIARVALLVSAASRAPGNEIVPLVLECYRQGDNGEKRAVLRALSLLPDPARFVEVGVGACRTSVQSVFEGICCENPYPAAHFPPLNFNQMVLKALFTEAALDRIVGLGARITPELARMAADYASERRAAGRSVPSDIERLLKHNGGSP